MLDARKATGECNHTSEYIKTLKTHLKGSKEMNVVSFINATNCLKAAKVLSGQVIATPRSISASCGLSIATDWTQEQIESALKSAGVTWQSISPMNN